MKIKYFVFLTITVLIFLINPLLAKEPLLPGAEDLARRMIQGVDVVKIVLYKVFTEDYSNTYNDQNEDSCKRLAGAAVNEIFDSHSGKTLLVFKENEEAIVNGIINLGKKYPDLKRPITDSIRVFIQANWMLTGSFEQHRYQKILKNAIDRGIFIKGGEPPEPVSFLAMVEKLAQKYNLY